MQELMYKVVISPDEKKFYSSIRGMYSYTLYEFILEYSLGEWTTPILGTKLFVFDSIRNAVSWANRLYCTFILECEIYNPIKPLVINSTLIDESFINFWKDQTRFNSKPPLGTYFVDCLKPIRVL